MEAIEGTTVFEQVELDIKKTMTGMETAQVNDRDGFVGIGVTITVTAVGETINEARKSLFSKIYDRNLEILSASAKHGETA